MRPSQRETPPPAVFKFFWMPGLDPETGNAVNPLTTTTKRPRLKPRKKISERPGITKEGRKKKRRRKKPRRKKPKRKRKPLREPFVPAPILPDPVPAVPEPVQRPISPKPFRPPPPPSNAQDATGPYG